MGAVEEQKPRVINSSNRNRNRTPSESRVDRPGLDDDNATSLKHGNKAFLDYMLNSVFVGSK